MDLSASAASADANVMDATGGERAAIEAEALLRKCGCNLGNVLFHPWTSSVFSIDTCIITGAPADYPQRLAALIDEVMAASEQSRPSRATRVVLAVVEAALGLGGERTSGSDAVGGEAADTAQPRTSGGKLESFTPHWAGLQRGFLEVIALAADMGEADLDALKAETLARTLLTDDANSATDAGIVAGAQASCAKADDGSSAPPVLAAAMSNTARNQVAKHLQEARQLVEKSVAVCRERLPRLRQLQLLQNSSM